MAENDKLVEKDKGEPYMIILISGNSCTGKTLMAQKLLEKYIIPYFSIDHLKMGLYRGVPDKASLWPI